MNGLRSNYHSNILQCNNKMQNAQTMLSLLELKTT